MCTLLLNDLSKTARPVAAVRHFARDVSQKYLRQLQWQLRRMDVMASMAAITAAAVVAKLFVSGHVWRCTDNVLGHFRSYDDEHKSTDID